MNTRTNWFYVLYTCICIFVAETVSQIDLWFAQPLYTVSMFLAFTFGIVAWFKGFCWFIKENE